MILFILVKEKKNSVEFKLYFGNPSNPSLETWSFISSACPFFLISTWVVWYEKKLPFYKERTSSADGAPLTESHRFKPDSFIPQSQIGFIEIELSLETSSDGWRKTISSIKSTRTMQSWKSYGGIIGIHQASSVCIWEGKIWIYHWTWQQQKKNTRF